MKATKELNDIYQKLVKLDPQIKSYKQDNENKWAAEIMTPRKGKRDDIDLYDEIAGCAAYFRMFSTKKLSDEKKVNKYLSYLKEDIEVLSKVDSLPEVTKKSCEEILKELDGLEQKLKL